MSLLIRRSNLLVDMRDPEAVANAGRIAERCRCDLSETGVLPLVCRRAPSGKG